jgi:hypothetical protein
MPPAGYAYVAYNTDAIRPIHPVLDYGEPAPCIDRAGQDNYQPIPVGEHAFALYSGADERDCKGTVIASAPSTRFGDGEVWFLYAMGDAAKRHRAPPGEARARLTRVPATVSMFTLAVAPFSTTACMAG